MTVIYRGKPACECLAKWLPVYERELRETGNLQGDLVVYQLNGNAAESAGTHTGGAYDVTDGRPDQGDVWIGRQMGAAEWLRTPPKFVTHRHGVLRGCPHNHGGRYQIGLLDQGFDGLVGNAPDNGPRNFQPRTWQEGIKWARRRQRRRWAARKLTKLRAEKAKLQATINRLRKLRSDLK